MSAVLAARDVELTQAERNPALIYLASLSATGRRSMASRLARVARMLGTNLREMDWATLRFEHVTAIRSRLREEGLSSSSVNCTLAALRGVARAAWSVGLMTAEERARVESVGAVRGFRLAPGRALNQGEIAALLDACAADTSAAGPRDAAVIALLLGGGLRRSEAVALSLADYSPETGLKVRGKGDKERLTYLEGGAALALNDWITVRGDWPGPLLCPVRKGGMVERRAMTDQAIYGALVKRATLGRIARLSPHDLRRTFASELIDASGDLSAVQQLLGHSNIATTTRYDRRPEQSKRRVAGMLHLPYRGRAKLEAK